MLLHSCSETFHDHLPDSACRVSPKPCGPAFKTSHSPAPADLSSVVCKCGCVLSKLDRWSSRTSLSVLPLNSYSCCRTCSWPSDVYCMISVRSCRVCQIAGSFSRFFPCRSLQRRGPSLCPPPPAVWPPALLIPLRCSALGLGIPSASLPGLSTAPGT